MDGTSLGRLLRAASDTLPERAVVTQFSRMNDPRLEAGDASAM